MVRRRVFKSQGTSLARSDKSEVEEPSQPGSQSSDGNQVTKLAIEMQREARKRREARRAVITKSYWEAVRKIETAMTLKFEGITRQIVKRHRLRIDRLSHLIQKRSTIEAKMFASSQNVENALIYADKALAFTLGRRLQSIQRAPIA